MVDRAGELGISTEELLDSAPDGAVIIDEGGTIRLVNRQAEALFGYDRSELIGRTMEMLVPERARTVHPSHRRAYFEDPATRPMGAALELTAQRKDGREVVVDISLAVLDTAGGRLAYAAVRDITSSRLAAIVASSDDAIIGKTLDGTITSWNAGAEQLYGYRADEVVGGNISVLIPPGRPDELPDLLERVAGGTRVEHFESQRLRKDHSVVDVSITISPILDAGGRVIGASAVARDVTDRRLAEEERAGQAVELLRSNAELEQFAYVASHDLSEPLRTISGYVELLARRYGGQIDAEADRFIRHTVEGCSRMRQLIDDMLDYSRVGRSARLTAVVDCEEVVAGVVAGMGLRANGTAGPVHHERLPMVRGDATQLSRLFQNLIANSVKFARPEVGPRVHIAARRSERDWLLSVSDNGIGIEAPYRERIFGIFQRLHGRDAYPGTGIGLAICLRIVQAHGGRIWVEDGSDGGTSVCFTLPAVTDEEEA